MGSKLSLQILDNTLLSEYRKVFPVHAKQQFELLHEAEISTDTFSFYTSVASVYSSKIEGEEVELDSYIRHKKFGVEYLPDYTKKVDDLYAAYTFAKANKLNAESLKQAHILLSKNLLPLHKQGVYRSENMFVTTSDGKIEYVAALPQMLNDEMRKLWNDIEALQQQELTFEEVFFYASLLHLVFVKIHPWSDGNGRTARLLEKWFLAEMLGIKSWFIQSEKNYYNAHQNYYNNIRKLGLEYDSLNYSEALPFLQMLPDSLFSK